MKFDRPVVFYVENFIGFPVGTLALSADASRSRIEFVADPVWGNGARFAGDTRITTPGGLQIQSPSALEAMLADPADLFSLSRLTSTSTVNERTWQSHYTAATGSDPATATPRTGARGGCAPLKATTVSHTIAPGGLPH